ncbi:hypothetical protein CDAR_278971 [Caerostris darwini]|uniref:Uncharacterized protein n=1 Tax=Caerostris darwini TaxID=1538125 RepID=A0AAV4WQA3_9ARAC|nr:hypothetical protein CDAR_278971 [Caerostris darwini]
MTNVPHRSLQVLHGGTGEVPAPEEDALWRRRDGMMSPNEAHHLFPPPRSQDKEHPPSDAMCGDCLAADANHSQLTWRKDCVFGCSYL